MFVFKMKVSCNVKWFSSVHVKLSLFISGKLSTDVTSPPSLPGMSTAIGKFEWMHFQVDADECTTCGSYHINTR